MVLATSCLAAAFLCHTGLVAAVRDFTHVKVDQSMEDATNLCIPEKNSWLSRLPPLTGTLAQNDGRLLYHPLERLVLCASGKGYLFTMGTGINEFISQRRDLSADEIVKLFATILGAWPRGAEARTAAQDGNFIFLLDANANLIVAPIIQRRKDVGFQEVKHGDLGPGTEPWEHGTDSGNFRGVARLGGEFDLAGDRSGDLWVVHQKSGFSLYRISAEKLRAFHTMYTAEHDDATIWLNSKNCLRQDKSYGLDGLALLAEYMRSNWAVEMTIPAVGYRCSFANPEIAQPTVHGSLPVLQHCERAYAEDGMGYGAGSGRAPELQLAEWYKPKTCNLDKTKMTAVLKDFDAKVPMVEEDAYRQLNEDFRTLREDGCWKDDDFLASLNCKVHGCMSDGFHLNMRFGSKLSLDEFKAQWQARNPYTLFVAECV